MRCMVQAGYIRQLKLIPYKYLIQGAMENCCDAWKSSVALCLAMCGSVLYWLGQPSNLKSTFPYKKIIVARGNAKGSDVVLSKDLS